MGIINGAGKKPVMFLHSIGINSEIEIDITIAFSEASYTYYEMKWSFCEPEKHPRVQVEWRQYLGERNRIIEYAFFIQDFFLFFFFLLMTMKKSRFNKVKLSMIN